MRFKTRYHLLPKEKINGFRKPGGCDSKHDITYKLRKKKINGVRKHGGCGSKHDITYNLKSEKDEWSS